MTSIRDEAVAFDTNVFIFALRKDANHPACESLLFDKLGALKIHIPLQILLELQHNLTASEMRGVFLALAKAKVVTWDYTLAPLELVRKWEQRGAKKGDAVVAAHLESANIRYFVSENRHFLAELLELPFVVLTSEKVTQQLA